MARPSSDFPEKFLEDAEPDEISTEKPKDTPSNAQPADEVEEHEDQPELDNEQSTNSDQLEEQSKETNAESEEAVPPRLDRQDPEEVIDQLILPEAAIDQQEEHDIPPDLGEAHQTTPEKPKEESRGLLAVTIQVGSKKLRLKIVDAPPKFQVRHRPFHPKKEEGDVPPGTLFNENPYICSFCGKNYSSRIKLMKHEAEHTGQKPFSCNYCGKGFTHKQSLVMHERIHTGEKPFQCPICTKCFARQTNYNIHMKLHASGRRYFCSFCGKWYRTEHEMLEHQQTCLAQMHGQPVPTDKPLRYQCSYCEKMFHHRRDKNIHERTHTGERPYTCGYCGKGFTQSQALTIHIRTHTGERPYTCAICGKDFRDSSALRKHEFVKHTHLRSAQQSSVYSSMESHGTEQSESQMLVTEDQLDAAVFAIATNH